MTSYRHVVAVADAITTLSFTINVATIILYMKTTVYIAVVAGVLVVVAVFVVSVDIVVVVDTCQSASIEHTIYVNENVGT